MIAIKPEDIQALIQTFERSSSQDMRLSTEGFELRLSKNPNGPSQRWERDAHQRAPMGAGVEPTPSRSTPSPTPTGADTAAPPTASAPASAPPGHAFVRAVNLGTFYRAPKPGVPNYVEIGARVDAETEVCLIEVMKLFTPLCAGIAGTVREVLVKDSQLVEFDQPLFLIELNA